MTVNSVFLLIGLFLVGSNCLAGGFIHPPFNVVPMIHRCDGAIRPAPPGEDSAPIIEAALDSVGASGTVVLIAETYELHRPVRIRRPNQTITTCQGNNIADTKTTVSRARLLVMNRDGSAALTIWGEQLHRNATALEAFASGTNLRLLYINGGGPWDDDNELPPELPPLSDHSALVLAGSNFSIEDCILEEPLGWTALQLSESGQSRVLNNIVRNCGRPGKSAAGYPRWADGISSFNPAIIKGNEVVNATDVGIVVFAPEALVENNHVVVTGVGSYLKGGIALGDCWSGGIFSAVVIQDNVVETTSGGRIGLGIHAGPTNWRCHFCQGGPDNVDIEDFSCEGSTLQGNILVGAGFEYGFVLSRLSGLLTSGNSFDGAYFSGEPLGCSGHVPPPNEGALVASEDAA